MIRPSISEARDLCEGNTIIPVSLELFSDMKTPIEVLKCLKEKSDHCYLLESVENGEKWGRYSFLGYKPQLSVRCNNGGIILENGETKTLSVTDPIEFLRKIISEYKSPKLDYLPLFTGGFVGYISYDFIKYTEKSLKLEKANNANFDDFNLMLFDKIIAFDHLKQKIIIIVNVKTDDFETNYINAVVALKEIETIIKSPSSAAKFPSKLTSEFSPLFSKEQYCRMVKNVKEHIYEGDIFQAVISNRMEADFEGDLLSTYRALRTINPSPYMFYISLGDTQIAGASPETLLSLKDKTLTTFPIAGTNPRGSSEEEDEKLIEQLMKNEKELSEHNMLVDLGRNDLGKISEFGSVKVDVYQKVLKFSHVLHITSTVTGKLKEGMDQFDAIAAVLPAGTLSGAPKIRACEIINELEGTKRGIYGGAVGYIDFAGNVDMCIAIRMAVRKNGKVYIQAGAGIVADSEPEREDTECRNKAQAMIDAVKLSQEVE